MRRISVLFGMFTAVGLLMAAPALAQGSGSNGGSAGGGSTSGGHNSSSLHVHTSGGASVGVTQGSVSGGSTASGSNGNGSQAGSAGSGAGVSGQGAGVLAPANAVQDGIVNQVKIPTLDLGNAARAADKRPDALTWAIAAVIVIGLVVLYRRIPRTTAAS
jgi:hypothetical protein